MRETPIASINTRL